jgi:predicted unusual protein kinase regulating ubiquinone biosynthesis (AarF/ABC1/UbiB family)
MADDPDDDSRKGGAPATGRWSRLAKLSSLAAGVASRAAAHAVAKPFLSAADANKSRDAGEMASARAIVKTLGGMKGAAMKLGQMLATDPSLLPEPMRLEVQQLQSQAPPMGESVVRTAVEGALGHSIEEVFERFDMKAIGAASMGQVHRARLRATSAHGAIEVAVKVQYPGIADTIHSDVKNLGSLLNVMRLHVPRERVDRYVAEVTEMLVRESDYLQEAVELERIATLWRHSDSIRVPTPVHELCRPNVLVMEFLDGVRLSEWLAGATPADRARQGERLLGMYLVMLHEHGVLHADPHPGNFLVLHGPLVDGIPVLGLLDCGCVKHYPLSFTDDLVRILTALWRSDLPALQQAWRALGFIDDGVDLDAAYEWMEFVLSPLLMDQPFDFATWDVTDQAVKFMVNNPSLKRWAPPEQVLFYLRTLAGLRGIMMQAGVVMNVHQVAKQVATARGLWP